MREDNCPGPGAARNDHSRHVELLEHAVLASLAYKPPGRKKFSLYKSCPEGMPERAEDSAVAVKPVPGKVLEEAIRDSRESIKNGRVELFHDPENPENEKFFTCTTTQTMRERLAVALRYVVSNDRLSLLVKFAIVGISVARAEKIGIVELKNADDDKILGIQGTDIFSLGQWKTSIGKLIENQNNGVSCLFPFAVKVSTRFFGSGLAADRYRNKGYYGIVGHSLGVLHIPPVQNTRSCG